MGKIAHLTAFRLVQYIVQHHLLQSGNLNDFLSNLSFVKGVNGHNYESINNRRKQRNRKGHGEVSGEEKYRDICCREK